MDLEKMFGLKEGANYTLMDTRYQSSRYNHNTGEKTPDLLTLIYKNNDTGEKKPYFIENPKIEAYIAKEDVNIPHPLIDIDIDKVNKIDLPYDSITLELAKLAGKQYVDYYFDCIKTKHFNSTKNMHKWERVFSSDVDIEDFYRLKSLEHLGMHKPKISKAFLDIEADIYKHELDLDECTGDAPINAVTIIDSDTKTSYTLILRDDKNPLIEELENDMDSFMEELHDEFDKEFGVFDYKIVYYDEELDLIRDIFVILNTLKPDFVMIWNMRFDIRYIVNRITELTDIPPANIMCHPGFKRKEIYFKLDNKSDKIHKRTDKFEISSFSYYIDQMILYASIRKAKSFPTYKLDYISEIEVDAKKLSYSDIGSIALFPHRDFRRFIKYNIKDVLLQYKIEQKVNDVEFMFQKSYDSGTRYDKAFKETTYLRNLGFKDFKEQGKILGNNQNANYDATFGSSDSDEKREKFEGAIVGNPALNRKTGILLFGRRSGHVFNNIFDMDVTSMYPSIIYLANVYPSTQYGRVIMDKALITKREVFDNYERYDRGGKFIEDLEINEPILFMYRWHGLPRADKVLEGFKEFDDDLDDTKKLFNKVKKEDKVEVKRLFKNKPKPKKLFKNR